MSGTHDDGTKAPRGLFDDVDLGDADIDLDEDLDGDLDGDEVDGDEEPDVDALRASSQAGEEVLPDDVDPGAPPAAPASAATRFSRKLRRVTAAPGVPLGAMLDGTVPMFVVHRSHRHAQHLPELLGVARQRVRGQAGIGVAVRLPRMAPAAAATFLGACAGATMKVADPEIFTLKDSGSPTAPPARAEKRYSWGGGVPAAVDPGWVGQVLASQADAGANVFLSASGWVPDSNGRTQLAEAMRWVRASRTELGDDPMFVNLTLPSAWLSDPSLRAALKQELVESNEQLWWLRFHWPIVEPRYGQLVAAGILDGYKDLATTAALEGKVLVLPNSGLTGWMATAWGAQGFSTGTSWTEQMYGQQPVRASTPGRPKAPAVERFFDRTILHTVPHTDHLAIAGEPGHRTCRCRFCRRLADSTTYDQQAADLHYLLECADLTASLNHRRPGLQALREVRDARAFTAALTTPLAGRSRPLHLQAWEPRLP